MTAGTCFSDDFSSIDSNWVSRAGDWSWPTALVDNTNGDTSGSDVLYRDADFDDGYLEARSVVYLASRYFLRPHRPTCRRRQLRQ